MKKYIEQFKENWKKIQKLQGKEKIEYLWTYYKHLLVAALFVILAIHTVCTMISNGRKENVLTVALVDTRLEKLQEIEKLEFDLKAYLGYEKKHQLVNIDTSAYSRETEENIAKMAVVMSVVSDTDAVICNREVYDRFKLQDIFVDWKELLGEEYENYQKYITDGVLDLSLIEGWREKQFTSGENSYFCVLKKSEHKSDAKKMLDYLLSEEFNNE